jgi:hypothetical protein
MTLMSALEKDAMDMLLAGNHPLLELLRKQYAACNVVDRDETGVGVFVTFSVPDNVARLPNNRSFELSDVNGEVEGLDPVGFILFVRDGAIDYLEGFSYGDRWPERNGRYTYTLYYTKKINASIYRAAERDWEALTRKLEGH